MIYAVIDTNVIVSSLKSAHPDSATVRVMDAHLVTGNTKHYPMVSFVVTPAQFCEIAGL